MFYTESGHSWTEIEIFSFLFTVKKIGVLSNMVTKKIKQMLAL